MVDSRSLISSADLQYAIGIHFEGNFDLWDAFRCGRYSGQLKCPQEIIIFRHCAFSLVHLNANGGLVVHCCGESVILLALFTTLPKKIKHSHLTLFCRDDSISRDKRGKYPSGGLNSKTERCNINDQAPSLLFSSYNGALYRGSNGYCFIWVDPFRRFFAIEMVFEKLANLGDTCGASNENDLNTNPDELNNTELGI